MNNNYYQGQPGSPLFTNSGIETPNQSTAPMPPFTNGNNNQYIDQTLNENIGKRLTVYATFNGSVDWPNKAFTGILEYSAIDHLTLSDPTTGKWYVIPSIYINYVESDEKIIE